MCLMQEWMLEWVRGEEKLDRGNMAAKGLIPSCFPISLSLTFESWWHTEYQGEL